MAVLQFLRFLNPKYLIAGVIFVALAYAFYIATDRIILQQELKNFKATEAQNHERNETNNDVNEMSDADKCKHLGGVFADGQCL